MTVDAWEGSIELNTYPLGPDDPNPPFQRQGGSWSVYPYPLKDDLLEGPPETRTYKSLHLENEYLQVTVLPELGGRVYSLYDKVCGRDVFYRNNVVKYGLVAVRGAWISGGIEFNFPTGHTYTTVDPVSYLITEGADGDRCAITVSNVCRVSGMIWSVVLSLLSGVRNLRQEVRLQSASPVPQRYWFWSNAAVPATDDLRLVFPAHKARVAGGVVDFPVASDGRDLSWYRNHDRADDIFTLDVTESFFGCHYEDSDFGMANTANWMDVSGRKFFTWGTADDGMIWADLLTDDDGQYVELQSGRFETQSEWGFLRPNEIVMWSEEWLPIHGMGGWVYANGDGALNFALTDGGIRVGATLVYPADQATLTLRADGARVWRRGIALDPSQPFCAELEMPPGCGPETEFSLTLEETDEDGTAEVLSYDHPPAWARRPKVTVTGTGGAARKPQEQCSADELCERATVALSRLEHREARRLCEMARARDADCYRARAILGLLDTRAGLFESARDHLRAVAATDSGNAEAAALLGWVLHKLGEPDEALLTVRRAALARPDMRWPISLARVVSHLDYSPPASERAPAVPRFIADNLYGGIMRPIWALLSRDDDPLAAFIEWARDDAEQWCAAYINCRSRDAFRILELALEHCPGAGQYPMVHYLLAHCYHRHGSEKKQARALERARACPVDYCFPSRVEELEALQFAVEQDPSDWNARYLLGNVLAGLERHEEAMAQWREALKLYDGDAVLHRNLGLGALRWEDNPQEAAGHYRRAIERNPAHYRYYLDLADIMARRLDSPPAERLELFRAAPEDVQAKWQIAARVAELMVELGLYDSALETLRGHRFFPWEGARHMRTVYVNALLGRAERNTQHGDHAAALADLEAAMDYPPNLGVGKPARPNDARIYWLAAAEAEQLGEEDKRTRYLTVAADEPHGGPCEADWWKLLALRELGRADEAVQLQEALRSWAESLLGNPKTEAQGREMLDRIAGLPG